MDTHTDTPNMRAIDAWHQSIVEGPPCNYRPKLVAIQKSYVFSIYICKSKINIYTVLDIAKYQQKSLNRMHFNPSICHTCCMLR